MRSDGLPEDRPPRGAPRTAPVPLPQLEGREGKGLAQGHTAGEKQRGAHSWPLPGATGRPRFPGLEHGCRRAGREPRELNVWKPPLRPSPSSLPQGGEPELQSWVPPEPRCPRVHWAGHRASLTSYWRKGVSQCPKSWAHAGASEALRVTADELAGGGGQTSWARAAGGVRGPGAAQGPEPRPPLWSQVYEHPMPGAPTEPSLGAESPPLPARPCPQ